MWSPHGGGLVGAASDTDVVDRAGDDAAGAAEGDGQ